VGITDNTIDVNIQLNAIDRKTQNRIPLANKNITIELVIGSKFVTKNAAGEFVLSDESAPFVQKTDENGTVSFTIYTQPPLLENSTDPRKISYSITASFTPKPKEPFTGSVKTERYVPGIFPLISLNACAPLFIIFALLIAAMFASGKNPFGLFDFSRVAFKAPGIGDRRVTTRQRTTIAGIAAGAVYGSVKTGAKIGLAKGAEIPEKELKKIEKKAEGKKTIETVVKVATAPWLAISRTLKIPGTKELNKLKMIELSKQMQRRGAEAKEKEKSKEMIKTTKGPFGGERMFHETPPSLFKQLLNITLSNFFASLGHLGVRPWSLSYAQIPQIIRPGEIYTKEELEDIKKKGEEVYGVKLKIGEDIDQYGLTETGKRKIAEKLGLTPDSIISDIYSLKGILNSKDMDKAKEISKELIEYEEKKLKSPFLSPYTKMEIKEKINLLTEIANIKEEKLSIILNKLDKYIEEKYAEKIINRIGNNGNLIGFDKNNFIGKIDMPAYYKNYGIDESKAKIAEFSDLAKTFGISPTELTKALEKNDSETLRRIKERVQKDPDAYLTFNYLVHDFMIGHVVKYLDYIDIKDEKGNKIIDRNEKLNALMTLNFRDAKNSELLTEAVAKQIRSTLNEKEAKDLLEIVKSIEGKEMKWSDVTKDNLFNVFTNGKKILDENLNQAKINVNEIQREFNKLSKGTPGYEEMKTKLEKAKDELWKRENEIKKYEVMMEKINNEIETLKLGNEMSKYAKEKKIDNVAYIGPSAIKEREEVFKASSALDALKTAQQVNNSISDGKQNVDELSREIKRLIEKIPPVPYRISKTDRIIMDLTREPYEWEQEDKFIQKFPNWYEKLVNADTTEEIINNQPVQTIKEMREKITKARDEVENTSQGPQSPADKERYSDFLKALNNMNTTLYSLERKLEESINAHIKENKENPMREIIDNTKRTVDPSTKLKTLDENEVFNKLNEVGVGVQYYFGKEKGIDISNIEQQKNKEDKEWVEKWWSKPEEKRIVETKIQGNDKS
ncbi:MAG: hypothetical protein QXF82_08955, partial [Nitrososphaeria archaeon]